MLQDDYTNREFRRIYKKLVLAFNAERAMLKKQGKMVEMSEQDWRDKHIMFTAQAK